MKILVAITACLALLPFTVSLNAAEPEPLAAAGPQPANAAQPNAAEPNAAQPNVAQPNIAQPNAGNGDIVGLDAAGPAMAKGTPAMWFGVKSCSQYVIFLVMDDGHMWQVDEDHHPIDMDAFLKSIAGLRHQLKVIPCAETL